MNRYFSLIPSTDKAETNKRNCTFMDDRTMSEIDHIKEEHEESGISP